MFGLACVRDTADLDRMTALVAFARLRSNLCIAAGATEPNSSSKFERSEVGLLQFFGTLLGRTEGLWEGLEFRRML